MHFSRHAAEGAAGRAGGAFLPSVPRKVGVTVVGPNFQMGAPGLRWEHRGSDGHSDSLQVTRLLKRRGEV